MLDFELSPPVISLIRFSKKGVIKAPDMFNYFDSSMAYYTFISHFT
jgi:hypothetical protein